MQKLIGTNILFNLRAHGQEDIVRQGTVKELSPNGKFVKIGTEWFGIDKVNVVDQFPATSKEAAAKVVELPTGEKDSDKTDKRADDKGKTPGNSKPQS